MTPDNSPDANETQPRVRLLHIVPEDCIGGVEIAARCAADRIGGDLRVQFLKRRAGFGDKDYTDAHVSHGRTVGALDFRNALCAIRTAREFDPNVILFSLWKTIGAFLLMRLLLRNRKFVLFVHSERSSHFIDWFATVIMARLSHAVWADSASALEGRLGHNKRKFNTRIVSFILHKPPTVVRTDPRPVFAYWGRLSRTKAIDTALELFHRFARTRADARFIVIGPDSGARSGLQEQVRRMELGNKVVFTGPMTMPEISTATAEASFFLQLSKQEGMAMSVVEAMQLGLVPVVTPVGAIKEYCRDGENAIFSGIEDTQSRIERVLADASQFQRMSRLATAQWADAPLYQDDLMIAARNVSDPAQAGLDGTNDRD